LVRPDAGRTSFWRCTSVSRGHGRSQQSHRY
jgi:hypothetical protein